MTAPTTPAPDGSASPSTSIDPFASELARLQRINEWHEQALAFANIGLYRWESASDQWFWSDEMYAIRGFPRDPRFATPADFYARVHPDDQERVLTAEIACKEGRAPLDVEYRFLLPSGDLRWHRERANLVRLPDGKHEILSGALIDITEQKRAELELERRQDHLEALVDDRTAALRVAKDAAESAHRAKNMFVANVSHELRTPLNAIMGMTDLALRRAEDPRLQGYLDKAKQASRRLLALINDLIDIADIEAERMSLDIKVFQPAMVAASLKEIFGPAAATKGLALTIEVAPDLSDRTTYGDPVRITQVVRNLADNAIKFSERGEITIRFRIASETSTHLSLHCSVEDEGMGIPEADLQRIFTLFEQGDGSSTRRHGGTGLGLALCRKLVHLMNGEIGVTSRPGVGSTFHFTVRLTPVAPMH